MLKISHDTAVDADFRFAGNVLPNVTYSHDLGVTITSDLSFSTLLKSYIKSQSENKLYFAAFLPRDAMLA